MSKKKSKSAQSVDAQIAPGTFDEATFKFLEKLAKNNDKAWFEENRQRYEDLVRTPALQFIEKMAPELATISPFLEALAMKQGGSLMRIYRDTRFSHDKRPYKTNIGIQFRHELGKDVHAPGYYFHLESEKGEASVIVTDKKSKAKKTEDDQTGVPQGCFLAAGIWRPDSAALKQIREYMVAKPKEWQAVKASIDAQKTWALSGDSLKRIPRGFDAEHAFAEDLKRKDYVLVASLKREDMYKKSLVKDVRKKYETAKPLMKFLCKATEVRF